MRRWRVTRFAPAHMERGDSEHTYLIGIDDTDNLYTPGTGYHARSLGQRLVTEGVAHLLDITRHQLLFDRRIRYTSHNSSLCLRVSTPPERLADVIALCRDYLLTQSAPDSDAGLCVTRWDAVNHAIQHFAAQAKLEILTLDLARRTAQDNGIHLEGLTGDHGGMIGALAAVGLRRTGQDGRVAWRPGVRETTGIVTAGHLRQHTGIDLIREHQGNGVIADSDRIDVGRWPRPVLLNGQAVLLVEKGNSDHGVDWQLIPKQVLKQF